MTVQKNAEPWGAPLNFLHLGGGWMTIVDGHSWGWAK